MLYELKINENQGKIEVLEFYVENFKGIREFGHNFTKNKKCVIFGKNGSGKSSVLESWITLFLGRDGVDIDNIVGPYADTAKMAARIKAAPGAFELGEDLWVSMSVTRKGTVNLKFTDDQGGKIHTTAPREKVKRLLNRFLDPVALLKKLKDHNGDKTLAAELADMAGLDLSPYVAEDERLAKELSLENRELERQRKQLESLPKPQDDWATERVEPSEITAELEKLRALQARNYEKVLKIAEAQSKVRQVNQEKARLESEIPKLEKDFEQAQKATREGRNTLTVKKAELELLKQENSKKVWKGRDDKVMEEDLLKLEEKIEALRTEQKAVREEQKQKLVFDKQRRLDQVRERELETLTITMKERVESRQKTAEEKLKTREDKQSELKEGERDLEDMKTRAENVEKELPLEAWAGDRDPDGKFFPAGWLKTRLLKAEKDNELHRLRQGYKKAEKGVESVESLIKLLKQNKKANQALKNQAVARVESELPFDGLTIDENTIWLDMGDGRGKRTINDISEGEKLKVCCHIIIALNNRDGQKLDVLLIKDGSALDADSRRDIYSIAAEYGYKVVLETVETTEAGALRIEAGEVVGVNPELETIATEPAPELETALNW